MLLIEWCMALLDGPNIPNTGILQEDRMCMGAESFVTAKAANFPKQASSRIENMPVVLIPILLDKVSFISLSSLPPIHTI